MQILGSGTESLARRGPIPSASFLGSKLPIENPSISSNTNFNDYIGRRNIIEQKRDKKTAFQREMDEPDHLKFPQSRSVGHPGALSRRSVKTNNPNPVGTPNLAVNSRAYTMGDTDETTPQSYLPMEQNAQNFTAASAKETYGHQKINHLIGSVRQSQSLATHGLASQSASGGCQSTSNLRGPRPHRISNAYQSTREIPINSPPSDANSIVKNDPACRRRQIAALRAHQILNEQHNDARLKAILSSNDMVQEKVMSPQYLSQNGFHNQQKVEEAEPPRPEFTIPAMPAMQSESPEPTK